jgi:hypothetical protein
MESHHPEDNMSEGKRKRSPSPTGSQSDMETEPLWSSENSDADTDNSDTESVDDSVTLPSEETPLEKRHLVHILGSLQLAYNGKLSLSKDKFLALLDDCHSGLSDDEDEDGDDEEEDKEEEGEEEEEIEEEEEEEEEYDTDDSDHQLFMNGLSRGAIDFLICVIKAGRTRILRLNKKFLRNVVKNLDIYGDW